MGALFFKRIMPKILPEVAGNIGHGYICALHNTENAMKRKFLVILLVLTLVLALPLSGSAQTYSAFCAPEKIVSDLYGYKDIAVVWELVEWEDGSHPDGYAVYVKEGKDGTYKMAGTTSADYFAYTDTKAGTKYTFKVRSYQLVNGQKYWSENYSPETSLYTLKKVSTPKVMKYSSKKVKVKWTNISGETGYQISRSTKSTGTNVVATYFTTKGTYKTLKVTKGKTYYYKVRAFRTVGDQTFYGPWSKTTKYKLK